MIRRLTVKRAFYLLLYYGFARYLPNSYSRFGGTLSKKIRYLICQNIFLKCGKNVNIERGAFFHYGDHVEIGDNSGIGINSYIMYNTKIGNDVNMGPNCYLLGNNHKFDRTDIPMKYQGVKSIETKVVIEDDVWIGRGVTILGSRVIKKGTIIGACTLLCKDFSEYSVVGGNPSKLIRSRMS